MLPVAIHQQAKFQSDVARMQTRVVRDKIRPRISSQGLRHHSAELVRTAALASQDWKTVLYHAQFDGHDDSLIGGDDLIHDVTRTGLRMY
jgi:hypothetical protein